MRYFSTFSGIGGFELGIERAYENTHRRGVQKSTDKNISRRRSDSKRLRERREQDAVCVGYSEIDKYAVETYQKHFNHKNYGDITKIDPDQLPDFDLLVGGFPCQAFSIAGQRRGFDDTRGTMFFELARIIKQKLPSYLLFENVKGLLSHDQGETFRTIIAALDELGYDCQWQVLNSKNHGVPQNRERVIIVGHLRGVTRPEVFPFGCEDKKDGDIQRDKKEKRSWTSCFSTRYGQRWSDESYIKQTARGKNKGGNHKISPTLSASRFDQNHHVNSVRKLTPTECERLQAFPDGWTEGASDTQRYKMCGNAVTVNVIADVMERFIKSVKI